jgi:translation initiation factor 2 subunit 1
VAKDNIEPPFVQIDGILELTCFEADGIGQIKKALQDIEKDGTTSVKVQYVGAPKYRILVRSTDYKTAENALEEAYNKAIEQIKTSNGEGKFSRED